MSHTSTSRFPALLTAMAVSLLMLFVPAPAHADTLTVTNTNDNGEGSLRKAIADATSGDTIDFDLTGCPCTITLTSGQLAINKNLTIQGPGADQLAVSGNDASRVFANLGVTVTISGLTITGGKNNSGFGGGVDVTGGSLTLNDSVVTNNSAGTGGGIDVGPGTLNINRTTISGNSANEAGGIYIQDATAQIRDSTISDNSGGSGEGIRSNAANSNTATMLINSTVSGNTSINNNSAIRAETGATGLTSTLDLINSTITDNKTTNAGQKGAIWLRPGPGTESLRLTNTIASGNTSGGSPNDIEGTADAASSFNLIGTGGGLTHGQNSNIVGVNDPLLGLLTDNGGPTQTHAPQPGSPAIDKGDDGSAAPTTDQRGVQRPQDLPGIQNATGGDGSDIGSVEYFDDTVPTLNDIDDGDADDQVVRGEALNYTLTFSEDIDESTFSAVDLENAGTAATSIGSPTESSTTPGVFTVQVTPTGLGTLVLRVKDGTEVKDVAGNELDTPVEDDTTVAVVNSLPIANNDTYEVDEDQTLTVPAEEGVLSNDTDADSADTLKASEVSGPSDGSLTLEEDGSFTYTPEADFSGEDTFTYKATDDSGAEDEATVTITVNPINDPPSFDLGQNQSVDEDAGAQTVTGFATNISPGASDDESGQSVSFTLTNDNNALFSTQPEISSGGTLTYTPAPDANGEATVTVEATDDGGTANGGDDRSDSKIFTITVNPVNDAVSANNDAYVIPDNQRKLIVPAPGVLENDEDPEDDSMTARVIREPQVGKLKLQEDGSFTYKKPKKQFLRNEFNGVTFVYEVSDGKGGIGQARVSVARE